MHFHPKDTTSAYSTTNKEKIAHLAYHVHYNQLWQNDKNGKFEAKDIKTKPIYSKELLQVAEKVEQQRQASLVELQNVLHVRQLRAKAASNIIHGLGAAHVRETALTIHGVYGIPYIPASSMKGIVRAWFIEAFCNGDEAQLASHPIGSFVFGTQEHSGIAQFYDVFLHTDLSLQPDILTTHYPEYYQSKRSATDDQKLNIVKFWTVSVREATVFVSLQKQLPAALQQAIAPKTSEQLAEAVANWTAQALTEFGVGSKTSSGYGLFDHVEDVTTSELQEVSARVEEQRQRAEKKRQQEAEAAAKREEEAQKQKALEAMTPEERLVAEITALDPTKQVDKDESKNLFVEVKESGIKAAAEALKAYWEQTGEWRVPRAKRKQFERVEALKQLLT
ncbi:type III-B CRISPR module RAMP protein Cmr6 [Caryophanon latum]|uniref:Type III-B CRISPR module RAMP protein Cmr6 n=1 Tax=Caryophanon latum TaxID=33977 RepID=A0A1C0YV41_9BACL|nr:type III-B CRISPR module RAMP protein Cmr6 [Caryophanon latum]OCS91029.1 type III-B CRISPR module RAMP protein Cmr6 [Caryophanon latum]